MTERSAALAMKEAAVRLAYEYAQRFAVSAGIQIHELARAIDALPIPDEPAARADAAMSIITDRTIPPISELPDDLRAPLHSLQADLDYLLARYGEEDTEVRAMLKDSIRNRLSQIEEASYRLANPVPAASDRVHANLKVATR